MRSLPAATSGDATPRPDGRSARRGAAGETSLVGGSAVQLAVRIEPHVRPGEIWATDAFKACLETGPTLYAANEIPGAGGEGTFNVKKAGSAEPDIWVRLYRIVPRTG